MIRRILIVFLLAAALLEPVYGVGQSAVLTLMFPPGGRGSGMGETFAAISDDASALFYNPAGLGLAPLANDWQKFMVKRADFIALASKKELSFAEKPMVWVATRNHLYRYNGKSWFDYESYLMEQNDKVDKVVEKFAGDEELAKAVLDTIKTFNRINDESDEEFLVELKLPFHLGIQGDITCIAMGYSDRLWVGTTAGLKRYDGVSWQTYSTLDGMIGNHVTAVTAARRGIWVGTTAGLNYYKNSEWIPYTAEDGKLPSNNISKIAVAGRTAWVGTDSGLVRIEDEEIRTFTKADGMLSSTIVDIAVDGDNNVWAAHPDGVTFYSGKKWKKFRFKNNQVYCITVDKNGYVWVGTNKGALRYFRGKPILDEQGAQTYKDPEWKHFHSRNSLEGDKVYALGIQNKDVWALTDKAVNLFDKADRQVLFTHEPLLPEFQFDDLYHDFLGMTWPTEEWGTLGLMINFINFGSIEHVNEVGEKLGTFKSWELVGSLCYGTQLKKDLSIGANAKFIYSPLANVPVGNQAAAIGKTVGVDAAVLKRNLFIPRFDLGVMLQNMGPPIIYIDERQKDPIPFNLKVGLGYHFVQTPVHHLNGLLDINRELVYRDFETGEPDPFYKAIFTSLNDESWNREIEQFILNTGLEYTYSNFFSLRGGFLYDPDGSRRELHFGVGIQYANLQVDWAYIKNVVWLGDGETSVRNGQNNITLMFRF